MKNIVYSFFLLFFLFCQLASLESSANSLTSWLTSRWFLVDEAASSQPVSNSHSIKGDKFIISAQLKDEYIWSGKLEAYQLQRVQLQLELKLQRANHEGVIDKELVTQPVTGFVRSLSVQERDSIPPDVVPKVVRGLEFRKGEPRDQYTHYVVFDRPAGQDIFPSQLTSSQQGLSVIFPQAAKSEMLKGLLKSVKTVQIPEFLLQRNLGLNVQFSHYNCQSQKNALFTCSFGYSAKAELGDVIEKLREDNEQVLLGKIEKYLKTAPASSNL